jgi:hypothetical protein
MLSFAARMLSERQRQCRGCAARARSHPPSRGLRLSKRLRPVARACSLIAPRRIPAEAYGEGVRVAGRGVTLERSAAAEPGEPAARIDEGFPSGDATVGLSPECEYGGEGTGSSVDRAASAGLDPVPGARRGGHYYRHWYELFARWREKAEAARASICAATKSTSTCHA